MHRRVFTIVKLIPIQSVETIEWLPPKSNLEFVARIALRRRNCFGSRFPPTRISPNVLIIRYLKNSITFHKIATARKATSRSSTLNIQTAQVNLRITYDKCEDNRIKNISAFSKTQDRHLVRKRFRTGKLKGKKSRNILLSEGDDHLKIWETHFKNLLNAEPRDNIQNLT